MKYFVALVDSHSMVINDVWMFVNDKIYLTTDKMNRIVDFKGVIKQS